MGKKRISIFLSEDLVGMIKAEAAINKMTLSQLIEKNLWEQNKLICEKYKIAYWKKNELR